MARKPATIAVSVCCYDDAHPDGERAFATIVVDAEVPTRIPAADRAWLLAEIGYEAGELNCWGDPAPEPSMWIDRPTAYAAAAAALAPRRRKVRAAA